MHAVRAIGASRAAGTITTHRRSKVALALLGVVLTATIAPGIASANHGRPHADVYLGQLQQDFAIEYPGHDASPGSSNAILGKLWDSRLASTVRGPAYVWDGRLAGNSTPVYVWDGRLAG
jgi:hypothetical protein